MAPPSSAMLYVDQLQDNNPSDELGEILPDGPISSPR
jgi:hypothetical protein